MRETTNAILSNNEPLLALAVALKPYGTHPVTGSRWCNAGIKAKDGTRVRLQHVRVGSKLKTSAEAVVRFFAALSDSPAATVPQPTPAARRKSAEDAYAELEAAGA